MKGNKAYVQVDLHQDGRDGDKILYAPKSVLVKLAGMLKAQSTDENLDAMGWFRQLITWDGKPTKKCPVVGAGSKGAKGFGRAGRSVDLDPLDKCSVEEFIMEFSE